jgi:hypothetical protein
MSKQIIASTENLNLVKNKLLDLYEQFDLMFTEIEQKAKQSYNDEQMTEFNKQLLIINQFATIVLMYEDISTRYIDNLKAIKTQNNQLDLALKYINQFATIVLMYEDISARYIDNLKAIKTQNKQLDKALNYISALGGDINLIKYS